MNLSERWNNILYFWANGVLDLTSDSHRNIYSPKSTKLKFGLILKELTADFLRIFRRTKIEKSKIWFLVLTQNNYKALRDIQKGIPDSLFVSFYRYRSTINKETIYFNLPLKFLYDLLYPFTLFLYWLDNKEKAMKYYDLLLAINGSYEECLRLLKKTNPKAIVFSNDHLVIARAMLLAANKLGIKTYYVQHASISEYFPPLEFTYAFLEGEDAYDKYKKCGIIKSKVHLLGMSKFDNYANKLNSNTKLETVGIPFNLIDNLDSIYNLVVNIRREYPKLKIIIRPHPGEHRNLKIFKDFSLSDPASESAFQFLTRTDAIISGDSSIHLEAVLLNVYPLYYSFNDGEVLDYYGFVKNGLTDFCKDTNDINSKISKLILSKPNVGNRARYFNSSINTDFYGKSTAKIIDIILDTINNEYDQ